MDSIDDIQFLDTNESWRERFILDFNEKVARHLHFTDGFTISAIFQQQIVGFISTYWRQLPSPLSDTKEGYIDILEVTQQFRRRGIATKLVDLSVRRAADQHAYQVRAWSSDDKLEVLPMWRKLGFGLCPAMEYHQGQEIHGFFVTKVLG
jgi:ribosomal protein S18 acetylase RimI-like enzyme